ncbi:MAG: hypothetical protein KDD51_03885 [Bdellovibrionales bacterium]|nr:hypothetical protein [Bdellovibrionales bacterium]
MKKAVFAFILLLCSARSPGMDHLYVGGRAGFTGLTSSLRTTHGSAAGFGVDLGFRTNPFLDVLLQFHQSRHNAGLNISSFFMSTDLNLVRYGNVDFFLSIGPGIYFFTVNTTSETKFGIHGGFGLDYWLGALRVGVVVRWHGVLSTTAADNFFTTMARLGYRINL